jgi:tetratricopeptide (TPR) repeat protein
VRSELRSLSKTTADAVARHLVAAGQLVDTDPEKALAHAYAARAHAARIGAVREAVGLTAYHAGEWAVALSELRAVRRMNGTVDHLPVEADCERALGRPERALELQRSPIVAQFDEAQRIELLIVAAGARRDLGQLDSAAVMLQVPELEARPPREWSARLRYAYADALLEAGRVDDARSWFGRTLELDHENETGASDRLLELEGVVLDEYFDEPDDEPDDEADSAVEAVEAVEADTVGASEPADDTVDEIASAGEGAGEAADDTVEEIASAGEGAGEAVGVDDVDDVDAAPDVHSVVPIEDEHEPDAGTGSSDAASPRTGTDAESRDV